MCGAAAADECTPAAHASGNNASEKAAMVFVIPLPEKAVHFAPCRCAMPSHVPATRGGLIDIASKNPVLIPNETGKMLSNEIVFLAILNMKRLPLIAAAALLAGCVTVPYDAPYYGESSVVYSDSSYAYGAPVYVVPPPAYYGPPVYYGPPSFFGFGFQYRNHGHGHGHSHPGRGFGGGGSGAPGGSAATAPPRPGHFGGHRVR